VQLVSTGVFLAVLLAGCALTYYLVEAPMQRLGRRVTARLDARFGPDLLDASAPAAWWPKGRLSPDGPDRGLSVMGQARRLRSGGAGPRRDDRQRRVPHREAAAP
jgi:hypothetical protein